MVPGNECGDPGAGNSSDIVIPTGIGARGAPNDNWRQFFHLLRRAYLRTAIGWQSGILEQQMINELGFDGMPQVKCKLKQSLLADVYALRTIASYGNGRLLRRAWLRTGYVTAELMVKWHNYSSTQEFLKDTFQTWHMNHT